MRNISGSPVAGKDADEVIDTLPLLERFQEEIRGDDDLCNMPRKFNISISGTRGRRAGRDQRHRTRTREKEIDSGETLGFNVRVGGGLGGREPRVARPLDVFVTPDEGVRRRPRVRRIVPRPRRPAGPREEPLALLRRRSRHRVDPRPARRGVRRRRSADRRRGHPRRVHVQRRSDHRRTGSRTTPASRAEQTTEGGTWASASQSVGCRPRKRSSSPTSPTSTAPARSGSRAGRTRSSST